MKKMLLSLGVIAMSFASSAQVSCTGISPASIAGNYSFSWAEPGSTWGTPDFTVPNTFIQDTLAIVDDGSTGTNPQGNPVSAEGCNPLVNGAAVTGKIAVIYRNTCEFGTKALNAQNAGAVGVIIINRDNETISMGGGSQGAGVNIPVIMLSSTDGATLVNEMANGPVVVFIGNKMGLSQNDLAIADYSVLGPNYTTANVNYNPGFSTGMSVVGFGSADSTSFQAVATLEGPTGQIFSDTAGPHKIGSGDTLHIFKGVTNAIDSFQNFDQSTYDLGNYTLTYTVNLLDSTDADTMDNTKEFTFSISDTWLSLAHTNASGEPVYTTEPSNSATTGGDYRACIFIEEPNANVRGVVGANFIATADTTGGRDYSNSEVKLSIHQWNDPWTGTSNSEGMAWDNLTEVAFAYAEISSNSDLWVNQYIELNPGFRFENNTRYLACIQTDVAGLSFGYDGNTNFNGVINVRNKPFGSLLTTDSGTSKWYLGYSGWNYAPSLSLQLTADASVDENSIIEGTVSPNPATDLVRISVSAEGNANLVVADLSGKIVKTTSLEMNNGVSHVNIADLENGMYIFNVTMENGQTAKINVVKN